MIEVGAWKMTIGSGTPATCGSSSSMRDHAQQIHLADAGDVARTADGLIHQLAAEGNRQAEEQTETDRDAEHDAKLGKAWAVRGDRRLRPGDRGEVLAARFVVDVLELLVDVLELLVGRLPDHRFCWKYVKSLKSSSPCASLFSLIFWLIASSRLLGGVLLLLEFCFQAQREAPRGVRPRRRPTASERRPTAADFADRADCWGQR